METIISSSRSSTLVTYGLQSQLFSDKRFYEHLDPILSLLGLIDHNNEIGWSALTLAPRLQFHASTWLIFNYTFGTRALF